MWKRMYEIFFWPALFLVAILIVPSTVWSACSSPAGVDGELNYAAGSLKYCNSTSWVTVNSTNTGVGCSNAGETTYRSSEIQYCNGTNWLKSDPGTDYDTCVAGDAGKFYWSSGDTYYWYCNGANWRRMGP